MKYLLDTNVISELARLKPNNFVKKWILGLSPDDIFLSVLTIGELRRGIENLDNCKRKNNLIEWVERDLTNWFGSNIIPITLEIAERWGYITATVKKPSLPAIDSLLAATALTYNLTMATRNTKDFCIPGLNVYNPFT